jgi:hypothetical protein
MKNLKYDVVVPFKHVKLDIRSTPVISTFLGRLYPNIPFFDYWLCLTFSEEREVARHMRNRVAEHNGINREEL